MARSRYVIGIDLGTTNTVVSYIDTTEASERGDPVIRLLPIPQLVADREVRDLAALPSYLYFATEHEVETGATRTPWDPNGRVVVGALARDRGALVPARQVSSAKSWLCNPNVDRTDEILPWGSDEPSIGCSPIEASARYLAHLRDTWNHAVTTGGGDANLRFERQDVVITVPASFDDEARELTVQAAYQAGIERFTLLEEPLAAFYAWIVSYRATLAERLGDGDLVLVCDVGGGTTDFSLIRARVAGGDAEFERIAVGEHLLLGGDNVDHTLARLVEQRLDGARLTLRQRAALRQQCRVAKERLLTEPDLERVPITVLGAGGAVVGGALKSELTVDDVEETIVLGFLPATAPSDLPASDRQIGLREIGLPYVQDPAITRHLAEFLTRASESGAMLRPDAVLFNGGFFTPEGARDQVVGVIASWFENSDPGWQPKVLVDEVAESAVAVGAAYYGLVRRGEGLRIGDGTARGYYIGVETGSPAEPEQVTAVCLIPRGTSLVEDGAMLRLDERAFAVLANQPVSFTLYSSTTRTDEHGAICSLPEGDVHRHAPLTTVLRYGRRRTGIELAVRVAATLTEMGTLDLWCESVDSENRWRLQFQLHGKCEPDQDERPDERPRTIISESAVDAVGRLLDAVFGGAGDSLSGEPVTPGTLMARLESELGHGKDAWPLDTTRTLFDRLVPLAAGRTASARHEARFLNLLGFCLRPGFGADGDERRVELTRNLYDEGPVFANDVQCRVEWEVFLQRTAGGLDARRQHELYERHRELLGLDARQRNRRINPQIEREAWRALASFEHLPASLRVRLGRLLLARLESDPSNRSFPWALARLGARTPFYASPRFAVSPEVASTWIAALVEIPVLTPEIAFAVGQIGARTNDPNRDIDEVVRRRAIARLGAAGFRERTLAPLRAVVAPAAAQSSRIFGESLPEGLRLVDRI